MKTPTSLAMATMLTAGALAFLPSALHAEQATPKPVLLVLAKFRSLCSEVVAYDCGATACSFPGALMSV